MMPDYKDKKSCFINNLVDAGCDKELIEKCEVLKENNEMNELINVLMKHKQQLLKLLHQNTNQIDCLDYLICKIKKESQAI